MATVTMSNIPPAESPICIFGVTSRIARLIRPVMPDTTIWAGRRADRDGDVVFDLACAPPPEIRDAAAFVLLAGSTDKLHQNVTAHARLAQLSAQVCRDAGIGHLLLMSSAAVYGRAAGPNSETTCCVPLSAYGEAKVEMERAALSLAGPDLAVTVLRIGNVAGADALLGAMGDDQVQLDVFDDGRSPRRSYIGPTVLAASLNTLARNPGEGVRLLNLAQPGSVEMGALLDAAGRAWQPRAAPPEALPEVTLDVAKAVDLLGDELPPADAAGIVADWQSVGGGQG